MHSELYERYIRSDEWQEKRRRRLELDGYKCVMCGRTSEQTALQVHHVAYTSLGAENVYRDLATLCGSCHMKLHRFEARKGTGNNWQAEGTVK